MQSAQAYAYAGASNASHQRVKKGQDLLSSSGGGEDDDTHSSSALNVSALATSLNQLPISQRFMIPRHLTATLVINGEEDSDEEIRKRKQQIKTQAASRRKMSPYLVLPHEEPMSFLSHPLDSAVVRATATAAASGVQKSSSEQSQPKKNNRREASEQDPNPAHPAHQPTVVDVSAADTRRRRNLLQRASLSPNNDLMMGYDNDDNQGDKYDNDNGNDDDDDDDDDDDVIIRLRCREMEGSPSREGDETVFSQYSVLPSLTRHKPRLGLIRRKPRLLQRPVLPLLTVPVREREKDKEWRTKWTSGWNRPWEPQIRSRPRL
jgi:hypothetical protein